MGSGERQGRPSGAQSPTTSHTGRNTNPTESTTASSGRLSGSTA